MERNFLCLRFSPNQVGNHRKVTDFSDRGEKRRESSKRAYQANQVVKCLEKFSPQVLESFGSYESPSNSRLKQAITPGALDKTDLQIFSNVDSTLRGMPGQWEFKKDLLSAVLDGTSHKEAHKKFPNVSVRTLQRARKHNGQTSEFANSKMKKGTRRRGVSNVLSSHVVEGFKTKCFVPSGSATDTWILPMPKQVMYKIFRNGYLALLRSIDSQSTSLEFLGAKLKRQLVKSRGSNVKVAAWAAEKKAKKKHTKQARVCGRSARIKDVVIYDGSDGTVVNVKQAGVEKFRASISPVETSDAVLLITKTDRWQTLQPGNTPQSKLNCDVMNEYFSLLNTYLSKEKNLKVWCIDSLQAASWVLEDREKLEAESAVDVAQLVLESACNSQKEDPHSEVDLTVVEARADLAQAEKILTDLELNRKTKVLRTFEKACGTDKLFELDFVFCPLNISNLHWILLFFEFQGATPRLKVADSFPQTTASSLGPGGLMKIVKRFATALTYLLPAKSSVEDSSAFVLVPDESELHINVPLQGNQTDCGVCVAKNCLYVSHGLSLGQEAYLPDSVSLEFRFCMVLDLNSNHIKSTLDHVLVESLEIPPLRSDSSCSEESDSRESDPECIHPPSYKMWRKILTTWRDDDNDRLKFKVMKTPWECPLCKRAPIVRAKLSELTRQLTRLKALPSGLVLTGDEPAKELLTQFEVYNSELETKIKPHEHQMETQRKFVQDEESSLPRKQPGLFKIIVYQDFVAQNDHNGDKVSDLIFTVIWRDEKGDFQKKYIDNYCCDKSRIQDQWFTRFAWSAHLKVNQFDHRVRQARAIGDGSRADELQQECDMYLSKGGSIEFRNVTHVLRTGDSGGHFHAKGQLLFESSMFQDYGLFWETHTLCKRHAWNLCDAHGGAGKRRATASAVAGNPPETAAEFASIINSCRTSMGTSRAYALENIDRSMAASVTAQLLDCKPMKKCCEFQYSYMKGDVVHREPGVVRMRFCSYREDAPLGPTAQFHTKDFIKRPPSWGTVCEKCTFSLERPVFHKLEGTNCQLYHARANRQHGQSRSMITSRSDTDILAQDATVAATVATLASSLGHQLRTPEQVAKDERAATALRNKSKKANAQTSVDVAKKALVSSQHVLEEANGNEEAARKAKETVSNNAKTLERALAALERVTKLKKPREQRNQATSRKKRRKEDKMPVIMNCSNEAEGTDAIRIRYPPYHLLSPTLRMHMHTHTHTHSSSTSRASQKRLLGSTRVEHPSEPSCSEYSRLKPSGVGL